MTPPPPYSEKMGQGGGGRRWVRGGGERRWARVGAWGEKQKYQNGVTF